MPEFFFHVRLEISANDKSPSVSGRDPTAAWERGVDVLSPFLEKPSAGLAKGKESKSSPRRTGSRPPDRPAAYQAEGRSEHLRSEKLIESLSYKIKELGSVPVRPRDQRIDSISIESAGPILKSPPSKKMASINQISKGIGMSANGLHTKGRYEPLDEQPTDSIWGIVHLYRDIDETPGLYGDALLSKSSNPWYSRTAKESRSSPHPPALDQDCTTLCILAVPSYLAPSEFLGFVGEETRAQVSHFRMIRTARANRYMVLMKFREGKFARKWQKAWNGKVFNSMEPETCHVVFIKSVEITINNTSPPDTFPDTRHDPFTGTEASTSSKIGSTKPLAPRTSSLVELPTCPVCLERMDETTGLLTILCQHVFHCTCLQKWSGGGCPVCRYTHDDFSSRPRLTGKSGKKIGSGKKDIHGDYYEDEPLECETCHSEANLWQCLICGKVGCGRYEAKHAFTHYQDTGHCFAIDIDSKRVWDYAGDGYVHRIIQNAADGLGGKLVELPGSRHNESALESSDNGYGDDISREKMEGLSLEYTHLLTSQLESQRIYFEEVVDRAADKASQASASAASALAHSQTTTASLSTLTQKYDALTSSTLPALERDRDRLERRAEKFEEMARKMDREYHNEKAMNTRLMERIEHLTKEVEAVKAERGELEEQNRDLGFFISSQDKLRDAGEEVTGGTVSLPDPPPAGGGGGGGGKRKGKGKGKK